MQKRYYSPFEDRQLHRENAEFQSQHEIIKPQKLVEEEVVEKKPAGKGIFGGFGGLGGLDFLSKIRMDDLILIGVIIVLLAEEEEEKDLPLIFGLVFLFLIEYIESDKKLLD